jgi:ParB/RepB/Spo0J family partition protein
MNQPQLGSFESIPLSAIRPSGTNPRKHFDQLALDELTHSVQAMGVTQPLLLRPITRYIKIQENHGWSIYRLNSDGGIIYDSAKPIEVFKKRGMFENIDINEEAAAKRIAELNAEDPAFEIVSGERRYRAATAAKLESVPAVVRDLTDDEALDIQMIENLQRADLHPVEEAEGYRALMHHGATVEDVAKKSGKTVGHVQKIVKLLTLEVDATQLFADGHLTLGHALLLARLTPKDQERALRTLLSGSGDWTKTPIDQLIKSRLDNLKREYMHGRRLVDMTETQLKDWISTNVLLQLADVPWHLGDASLLPIAGACVDCPKRSGANAALFADITTADDVCLDSACFGEKQEAQQKRQVEAAKTSGKQLLKISAATDYAPLEEKAVQVVKGATEVTRKKVKQGQWVPAKEGECNATIEALVVDGVDKGKLRFVCPDQQCKVHKHTVVKKVTSISASSSPKKSTAEQEAEAAKLKRYQERETYVRVCVFRAILNQYKIETLPLLRRMVQELSNEEWSADPVFIAHAMDMPVSPMPKDRNAAELAIDKLITKTSDEGELFDLAFLFTNHELLHDVDNETEMASDRLRLDKLAKANGLKEGIKRFASDAEKSWDAEHPTEPAAPVAAKAVAKKAPAKKAPAKKTRLSPEARQRIADNLKKRWAANQSKKSAPAAETAGA